MKAPTWATVIGIIMILFGGCGALSNVQKIQSPNTLDEMSGTFEEISSQIKTEMKTSSQSQDSTSAEEEDESDGHVSIDLGEDEQANKVEFKLPKDSSDMAAFEGMFGKFDKMLVFSDYYKTWIVRLGILGLIASIIYLVSGLLLIMGKSFSLNITYGAIAFQFVLCYISNCNYGLGQREWFHG